MGKNGVNNISNARFNSVLSTVKNYREIEVVFNFNGKEVKRFYHFKEQEGLNEADYIKLAKERFEKEIYNGTIDKFSKKSLRAPKGSGHHALVALAAAATVGTVAFAAAFTYRYLNSRTDDAYHNVTFVENGGTEVDDVKVKDGETIAKPTAPSRAGYNFQKWCIDSSLLTPYDFSNPVKSDLVLYADWGSIRDEIVTFDLNYEDAPEATTIAVDYGEKVSKPDDPIHEGYDFEYWSIDKEGSSQFNFDSPIVTNVRLYAHWSDIKTYTVNFVTNGGSTVSSQTIEHGSYIDVTKITTTRPGYTFNGWEDVDGNPFNVQTTPIKGDVTLYARWTGPKTCTVTFDANGGTPEPKSQSVNYGEKVVCPSLQPTKDGWTFDYWYDTSVGEDKPFDFASPITWESESYTITLKAKYSINSFTVSFDANGGTWSDGTTAKKTFTIDYGTNLGQIKKTYEQELSLSEYPEYAHEASGFTIDVLNEKGEWTTASDSYVIEYDNWFKYHYTYKTGSIVFAESSPASEGSGFYTPPSTLVGTQTGTTWKDVKGHFLDNQVKSGYELSGYYYINGSDEKIILTDGYVFDFNNVDSITIYPKWTITVSFAGADHGFNFPHITREYNIGDKIDVDEWLNIIPTAPTGAREYDFDYFVTDQSEDVKDPRTITDPYVVNGPRTFTAQYKTAEAGDFEGDTWNIFTTEILKPYNEVLKLGAPYYDEYVDNNNTFVGLERTISLNNIDYNVRVVDEDDPEESLKATKPIVLTFEFEECINKPIKFGLDNIYNESNIDTYLDGLFAGLPSGLQAGINSLNTSLPYYKVSDTNPNTYELTSKSNTKLFIPSAGELGFTNYPSQGSPTIDPGEGSLFDYYDGTHTGASVVKNIQGTTTSCVYWTRSTDITLASSISPCVWPVNSDGNLGFEVTGESYRDPAQVTDSTAKYYVAPAFKI